jgi:hypothetical protein
MVLDSEIFSLIEVKNKKAEQEGPDQKKGEKSPECFNHVF